MPLLHNADPAFRYPLSLFVEQEDDDFQGRLASMARLEESDNSNFTRRHNHSVLNSDLVVVADSNALSLAPPAVAQTSSDTTCKSEDLFSDKSDGRSSESGSLPRLSRSGSSVDESSVDTHTASGMNHLPVLPIENGHTVDPYTQSGLYPCLFKWNGCNEDFDDLVQWKNHHRSHFWRKEPPRSVTCPHCKHKSDSSESGWIAWDNLLDHVADHCRQGEPVTLSKPDAAFLKYLWKKKLIKPETYRQTLPAQDLMGGFATMTHGQTKPRHQRGQP